MAVSEELQALLRPQERTRLQKISDVGMAVAEQIGGGRQVGQTLQAQRQLRGQERQNIVQEFVALEGLGLKKDELELAQMKFFADQGSEEAKAILDVFDTVTSGLSPQDRASVWRAASEDTSIEVSRHNAMSVFSEKLSGLKIKEGKSQVIEFYTPEGEKVKELITFNERDGTIYRRSKLGGGKPVLYQPTTDPTLNRNLIEAEVNTQSVVNVANKMITRLRENPEIITAAGGGFGRLANSLVAEVQAGARAIGVEDRVTLSPDIIDPELRALGIESAVMQSDIVNLAYAAALANGQTGRSVSDKDVVLMLRQIGATARDADTMEAVLRNFVDGIVNRFTIRQQVILGRDHPDIATYESFGIIPPLDADKLTAPATPKSVEEMTDAELLGLE